MIERYISVPDADDTVDLDGYNNPMDNLKGVILNKYRGREVRITIRAVREKKS